MKEWYWDEFKQTGLDFGSEEEVSIYDQKYKSSRNFGSEAAYIARSINLKREHTILEIGAGTAELTIRLAPLCKKVIAADVSTTMLSYARKKTAEHGIENIDFILSGFLDIPLVAGTIDAVISQIALHHLPDFWKSAAILNISRLLKPGGKFFLTDSIMSFDIESYDETITSQMNEFRKTAGEKITNEFIVNIRDEYPTYSWVIEQMLIKTGFKIDRIDKHNPLISSFICTKV